MKLIKKIIQKRFQENSGFVIVFFFKLRINGLLLTAAWDQAPCWGAKKKKWASEASRAVVWGGERVIAGKSPAALSPSLVHRSACFPRRFVFAVSPRFFLPFSANADPGPRLY